MIGGIAAGVGLLVILYFAFGGSGDKKQPEEPPTKSEQQPAKEAAPKKLTGGKARAGKTPDEPAPKIDPAKMAKAEELFKGAKADWNEAQKARGDRPVFKGHLDAAWEKFEEQRALLEEYSDWYEKADFGGWAIPAEYEALTKRQHIWGKVRQSVHKVKG